MVVEVVVSILIVIIFVFIVYIISNVLFLTVDRVYHAHVHARLGCSLSVEANVHLVKILPLEFLSCLLGNEVFEKTDLTRLCLRVELQFCLGPCLLGYEVLIRDGILEKFEKPVDWSLTLLKNSFSEDGSHDGLNQLKALHTSLLNRPVMVIRVLIEILESQEIA